MTNQHRATPEQWEFIELYADSLDADACILELRSRIEALEAAQQPHQDKMDRLIALDTDDGGPIVMPSSPADFLIDRVVKVIYGAEGCRDEARAAILEVAAWLRAESEGHLGSGLHWAKEFEREASR
jgi:hypothetical protein